MEVKEEATPDQVEAMVEAVGGLYEVFKDEGLQRLVIGPNFTARGKSTVDKGEKSGVGVWL